MSMTESDWMTAIAADDSKETLMAYSDWLEETGDYNRAIFVRCQLKLSEIGNDCKELVLLRKNKTRPNRYGVRITSFGGGVRGCRCETCTLRRKEWKASSKIKDWFGIHRKFFKDDSWIRYERTRNHFYCDDGFMSGCYVDTAWWLKHGPDLVKRNPFLRSVSLRDRKSFRLPIDDNNRVKECYIWCGDNPSREMSQLTECLPTQIYREMSFMQHEDWIELHNELSKACLRWAKKASK